MIIVKSIKEKPEECRGCKFHDKEGDCYLLPESRCYETYAEQYEHCPIEEAPDINVGNMDTTTHDSIPVETGKNDGDGTSDGCISRQQAIDALRNYLVEKRCPDDGTLTCRLIENEVINKLPSAQLEQRWVPCSERFPNKFEDVWVTDNRDRVAVCHRGHSGWRDAASGDWMYYLDSIVAWMPYYVPEPYQERGDQDGMEK